MDIEAYTNIDNAKIDSKENIESFVQLCDDYFSNNNHDDLCIGAILNKFFKIVENLAQQIESLNKDFITKGFEDEVESLRSKADNINETAMKVLHIIDIIPKKFTLNDENLQHIQNASSVWARYAVLAEKLVSEDISSSGILNMDKFINKRSQERQCQSYKSISIFSLYNVEDYINNKDILMVKMNSNSK